MNGAGGKIEGRRVAQPDPRVWWQVKQEAAHCAQISGHGAFTGHSIPACHPLTMTGTGIDIDSRSKFKSQMSLHPRIQHCNAEFTGQATGQGKKNGQNLAADSYTCTTQTHPRYISFAIPLWRSLPAHAGSCH